MASIPHVVHVNPDVMRRAMRVPDSVLFAADVGEESQLEQSGLDDLDRAAVDIQDGRSRPSRLNAFQLRL